MPSKIRLDKRIRIKKISTRAGDQAACAAPERYAALIHAGCITIVCRLYAACNTPYKQAPALESAVICNAASP
jgi:hypothetical protein